VRRFTWRWLDRLDGGAILETDAFLLQIHADRRRVPVLEVEIE
jgi:hypothetical protein